MQALRLGAEFLQCWPPALVSEAHPVQTPEVWDVLLSW